MYVLHCIRLLVSPQIIAHQAPLSMGFSQQEYSNGLPFPLLGDLPKPGIEPESPAWQADSLLLSHWGNPNKYIPINNYFKCQWTNQKTYRLADWMTTIKNITRNYTVLPTKRPTSVWGTQRFKAKRWKKILHANGNDKKGEVVILI